MFDYSGPHSSKAWFEDPTNDVRYVWLTSSLPPDVYRSTSMRTPQSDLAGAAVSMMASAAARTSTRISPGDYPDDPPPRAPPGGQGMAGSPPLERAPNHPKLGFCGRSAHTLDPHTLPEPAPGQSPTTTQALDAFQASGISVLKLLISRATTAGAHVAFQLWRSAQGPPAPWFAPGHHHGLHAESGRSFGAPRPLTAWHAVSRQNCRPPGARGSLHCPRSPPILP